DDARDARFRVELEVHVARRGVDSLEERVLELRRGDRDSVDSTVRQRLERVASLAIGDGAPRETVAIRPDDRVRDGLVVARRQHTAAKGVAAFELDLDLDVALDGDRLDVPWRVLLRFDPKRQLGRRERVERKPAVVVGLDRSKRRLTAIARRGIREIERDGARAVSERPGDL